MDEAGKLKKELQEKKIRGLALDIDDTLSVTAGYWAEIISQKHGNPENFKAHDFHRKYKFFQQIPYYQTKEILVWVHEKINDDIFQEEIPLVEDAAHIVNKIHKIIPVVAYITGRPERIKNGTKRWLEKHNFPDAPIIAKPDNGKADIDFLKKGEWKVDVVKELYPEILGIVDDAYAFAKQLSSDYQGTVFLYNHDMFEDNGKNVIPCPTWDDVYLQVKKKFGK